MRPLPGRVTSNPGLRFHPILRFLRWHSGTDFASATVADEGPGIAQADQERIFERFEQAEQGGGAGLGLAIARRLARSMGGDITLVSAAGEGARFTLSVPLA